MKHCNRLTTVLAFAIAVAAPPSAGAQTKDPIKLAIGVDAAYVPIYHSKQSKLFEKHGVNVELSSPRAETRSTRLQPASCRWAAPPSRQP
jgi:ABC-type nitrate/sulfonate/bicarbonate transport system substrate-binding protein